MTDAEIEHIVDLMRAAGRSRVPIPLTEWREYMATKSIGKVSKSALEKGKIAPVDTAPKHAKIAKRNKAARTAKRLRANREANR